MADRINIEVTPQELEALQKLRAEHAIPGAVGQPMPYDPAARAWGEAPPANPVSVQRLPTTQQWVEKQLRNLQAVGETNYRIGIANPKKDPIQAGIAAQGKWEATMRDPATLKRREEKLRQTNSDEWASMAERVGASRLVQGVIDRAFKVERAVGKLQPLMAQHLQRIDALPNTGPGDSERRMVENLRGLRAMKGKV